MGDDLARRLVFAGLCLSLACMVWMFKELAYPSRYRTPGWLKGEVGGVRTLIHRWFEPSTVSDGSSPLPPPRPHATAMTLTKSGCRTRLGL